LKLVYCLQKHEWRGFMLLFKLAFEYDYLNRCIIQSHTNQIFGTALDDSQSGS